MNLLSGSTWKGAKLRFGEAKPDFKEKCGSFFIHISQSSDTHSSQGLPWRTIQLKDHLQKNEENGMKVHKQKTCRSSLQQM